MGSLRRGIFNCMRGISMQPSSSLGCRGSPLSKYSTSMSFDEFEKDKEDTITDRKESGPLEPQGVDPKKGWNFRGVHKAIICGRVGQPPVQKILRNGRTVTIFTVGTGGMYDQRIVGGAHLPRPAQWHRITVHNEPVGAYAVQQLMKNSAVFVEGDIETRVYNDSITGQIKNIPEICVRRDGKVRLIKTGDAAANISLNELREGLF
ncbi:single-stranded DNA-binding protein, mitochondrial [Iris pallida]|uniref:Single-stranded DNA-binding protein, mitochondrial n=1 Tax=Iris pallida TaxID=29817 RepID=A0AAX6HU76_IRIPA|nr:single-stranded DNA-binding protein, mitochondrial [Iris pallida]KAJ6844034.1 single-stranded DNA-binding protein, mitochondrial [Iris pallida]